MYSSGSQACHVTEAQATAGVDRHLHESDTDHPSSAARMWPMCFKLHLTTRLARTAYLYLLLLLSVSTQQRSTQQCAAQRCCCCRCCLVPVHSLQLSHYTCWRAGVLLPAVSEAGACRCRSGQTGKLCAVCPKLGWHAHTQTNTKQLFTSQVPAAAASTAPTSTTTSFSWWSRTKLWQ